MAASFPGKGIGYQGSVTSTQEASSAFDVVQYMHASFQIQTDGSAAVSYTIQASNVPSRPSDLNPPFRNDATTSNDWSTVSSGTVSANTGGANTLVALDYCPYRAVRVLLSSTGTVQTTVYVFGTGLSS